jgi:type IV pilus assembly protein PilA
MMKIPKHIGEHGFTLVEIMIVIAIIIIIGALAIPGLMRSRLNANEAAAVAALKAISAASVMYRTTYTSFPQNISSLYDPNGAQYVDSILASGSKQGYNFSVAGDENGFTASAIPSKPNITGSRYFFLDSNGVIRASRDGEADSSSPAI